VISFEIIDADLPEAVGEVVDDSSPSRTVFW
jgi:hypothetical protein